MSKILSSNAAKYRLIRTIIQGVIGVIIANLDTIIGAFHIAPGAKVIVVALVMAILSPIMEYIGRKSGDDVG